MSVRRLDAPALREWAHLAVDELIAHTDEINKLNVFPVADADTGTNMLFTMRSAWAHADAEPADGDVAALVTALAAGALQGARGNSGVILSQILLAVAEMVTSEAANRSGDLADIDGALLSTALRHAVGLVVSTMVPVSGTIVSVLQMAAAAAERSVADGAGLAAVLASTAEAAADALDETTAQLDVLAEAGVVDAGGRGLLILLDALTATVTGTTVSRPAYNPAAAPPVLTIGTSAPRQFEVMYLLSECDVDAVDQLRAELEKLGESVAIATSDAGRYSVHVHVDDAGAAVEAGLAAGALRRIQITALAGAARARPAGGWARERAVLAVVDGVGGAELFAGEGAYVLRPDVTEPVTAKQLLRALVDIGAAQVMVLPNGYVAAEELVAGCTAATGWGIDVVPVPTGSMVQGLAALAVHDADRQPVDDVYTMARAAAGVRHGSVRVAEEEALTWAGTCLPGQGLGIAGDEVLIVGPDITAAATGLIDLLLVAGGELVTVLTGDGVDPAVGEELREHVRRRHLGAETVIYHTGHGGDALLIGVE